MVLLLLLLPCVAVAEEDGEVLAELTELLIERESEDGPKLVLAQPIAVKAQSCLVCHSTPAQAPPSMIDLYGEGDGTTGPGGGGFGWSMGEVVAAQITSAWATAWAEFCAGRTSLGMGP